MKFPNGLWSRKDKHGSTLGKLTMSTSRSIHPLGFGDTDQIDPVVAEALTSYQVEWLFRQCQDLRFKKLQILRQALFEWIQYHPDYRFSDGTFGSVMCVALQNYMNLHEAEFISVRPRAI
jgi:hypothetical protein